MGKSKIQILQEQLYAEKRKRKTRLQENCAKHFSKELRENATEAELHFMEIAERKHITLEFQVPVYIYNKGSRKKGIKKFYIVDFLDRKNKYIFETDGEYHNTSEQRERDYYRTLALNKLGYTVYRISNKEVLSGGTTSFLYRIYPHLNKTGYAVQKQNI